MKTDATKYLNCKGLPEFNPKGMPEKIIGRCQNEDHESWVGEKPHPENLRLIMMYSDDYNTQNEIADKYKMTDEELDKFLDDIEKFKWEPNSEQYWCEYCMEGLE